MAAGAYWRCPICLRRVPEKVVECYCGRVRQPGDGPDAEERPRRSPFATAGLGALFVAAVALAVWITRPPPPAAPRGGRPSPEVRDVSERVASGPRAPGASAAATTTTLPGAARAYDVAMRHVRHQLRQLSARLDHFERICGPGSRHSACGGLGDQIAREAEAVRATYDAAEAKARQAWLDGGLLMDIRQRNGTTEGDVRAVLSRAAAARAR